MANYQYHQNNHDSHPSPPPHPNSPWLSSLPDIIPEDNPPDPLPPPYMTFTCGTCERTIGDSTSITCAIRQSYSFALDKLVGITLGDYATSATTKPTSSDPDTPQASPSDFDYHCLYRPIHCGKCGTVLGKNYKSAPIGLEHLCEKFALARDRIGVYHLGRELPALQPGETEEILRQLHPEPDVLADRVERLMGMVVILKQGQDELFERIAGDGGAGENGSGGGDGNGETLAGGGRIYRRLDEKVADLASELEKIKELIRRSNSTTLTSTTTSASKKHSQPQPPPPPPPHQQRPQFHAQGPPPHQPHSKRKRAARSPSSLATHSMATHRTEIANSFNEEDGDNVFISPTSDHSNGSITRDDDDSASSAAFTSGSESEGHHNHQKGKTQPIRPKKRKVAEIPPPPQPQSLAVFIPPPNRRDATSTKERERERERERDKESEKRTPRLSTGSTTRASEKRTSTSTSHASPPEPSSSRSKTRR